MVKEGQTASLSFSINESDEVGSSFTMVPFKEFFPFGANLTAVLFILNSLNGNMVKEGQTSSLSFSINENDDV
jgi:hypothetical protein